jgi:hypothetical protein
MCWEHLASSVAEVREGSESGPSHSAEIEAEQRKCAATPRRGPAQCLASRGRARRARTAGPGLHAARERQRPRPRPLIA